ncbi:MAG: HDOD domain-containing protein [Phycisphaerales bacterium]|nr:HDOD domain-containing protein [Phycisphaerales bacterium]
MIYVADNCGLDSELFAAAMRSRGHPVEVCPADSNLPLRVGAGTPQALVMALDRAEPAKLEALRRVRAVADSERMVIIALCRDLTPESIMALVLAGADDIIDRSQCTVESALDGVERALRRELPPWWPARLAEQGHTPATLRRVRSGEHHAMNATPGAPTRRPGSHAPLQRDGDSPGEAVWDGPPPHAPAELDDALRALRPLVKRQEMLAMLDGVTGVRAISPAVAEALRVCGRPDASLKDVVAAVRVDQAMAVKVLTLANSPLYNRGDHVRSLHHAVGRIGIQHIRLVIMNLAVMERFAAGDGPLDQAMFWEHSISTGLIFAELVRGRQGVDPDTAFTLGLLHDIGRVALSDALGPLYARVISAADAAGLPLELVEKRMLLLDHGEAAERVLRGWKFPRDLIPPIVAHHVQPTTLRRFPPHDAESIFLLALANHLAAALLLGASGNLTIYPTEELCERLRVGPDFIAGVVANTPRLTAEMRDALMTSCVETEWPDLRERLRSGLPEGFRPIYRSARPGVDAIRVFCDRLRADAEGAPNVIVAHFRTPRDAVDVWNGVLAAEQAAGVGPLPALLLCESERCDLPAASARGRRVRRLLTPFNARLFVECARRLISPGEAAGRSAA